jgi:hypothetical protein
MKKITLTYKYDHKIILYVTEHFAWEEVNKEEADTYIIVGNKKLPALEMSTSDVGAKIMHEDLEKVEVEDMPGATIRRKR